MHNVVTLGYSMASPVVEEIGGAPGGTRTPIEHFRRM